MKKGQRKIGEKERATIIGIVKAGGSIADAAGIIGVTPRTIRNAMKAEPDFSLGVKKAAKDGKMRLINRVGKAKPWQAAAWMLERKYGAEYGRRDVHEVRQKRTVKHEHLHVIDYDRLASDLDRLSNGRVPANGNGKPVHPRHADTAASALPGVAGT